MIPISIKGDIVSAPKSDKTPMVTQMLSLPSIKQAECKNLFNPVFRANGFLKWQVSPIQVLLNCMWQVVKH